MLGVWLPSAKLMLSPRTRGYSSGQHMLPGSEAFWAEAWDFLLSQPHPQLPEPW